MDGIRKDIVLERYKDKEIEGEVNEEHLNNQQTNLQSKD
jgi:hypothetical protein